MLGDHVSITSQKDFWINTFLPFSAAMAASGTLIPLFIISAGVGGTVADIGIFSAISTLVSLPLAFIWGKLTDDSGKRKIFILVMFLSGCGILLGYAFSNFLGSSSQIFLFLLILAIMSGLLLGSGSTARTMYIFDKYPPDQWEEKISKYQQRSGLGACFGLVFGGLFQTFFIDEYMLFFLICAILCGLSAAMAYLYLKDVSLDKRTEFKTIKSSIMNSDLPVYSSLIQAQRISYKMEPTDQKGPTKSQITSTLVLFFLGGFTLFLASNLTFTPLAAYMVQTPPEGLGIPPSFVFWVFLSYYAISVVGYTFAGNWIDKRGNRKILFTGLFMRIAVYGVFAIFSFFTFALTGSFIYVIVLLVFGGLSYSLMNVALQNALPRLIEKNVGEILAIYSIIIGSSAIIGSYFSGFLALSMGYFWVFILSVIFAAIAGVIYWFTLKKKVN